MASEGHPSVTPSGKPKLLDQVSDHRELMQADGIHPTAAAQAQILTNVWLQLEPLLTSQQASH